MRFFVLFFVLFVSFSVHASWVDDWFNNAIATGSGPGMVKGSARNYYSAGYGSVRWKTGVDYPISVQLPSVRFGCGGVDIFLGSMDLMSFDYLVSRLKNIMYTAGAFAFQYALARLNPKANQILQALDATANFLNQLQLDECRAGKAIAVKLIHPFSPEEAEERGTRLAEIKQVLGIEGSWKEVRDAWEKVLGQGKTSSKESPTDVSRQLQGCSARLRQIAQSGYFLKYLAQRGFIVSDFIPVMRGLIGDIRIDPNTGSFFLIEPCPQKVWGIVPAVVAGDLFQCSSISGQRCICTRFTQGKNLSARVREYLVRYMRNLSSSRRPPSDITAFIRAITHYPVINVLKMAYQTGIDASLITSDSNLVRCATEFYAAGLLANVLTEAKRLRKLVTEWKAECSRSPDVGRCIYCRSDRFSSLEKAVETLIERADEALSRELDFSRIAKLSESCLSLEKAMTVLNRLNEIEQKYTLSARLR